MREYKVLVYIDDYSEIQALVPEKLDIKNALRYMFKLVKDIELSEKELEDLYSNSREIKLLTEEEYVEEYKKLMEEWKRQLN